MLGSDDQIRIALPWVEKLVLANPEHVACRSYMLATWLIEMRSAAADAELLTKWQRVVDALVVAGKIRLASYSD